jgi:hypothetical protein
MQYSCAIVHCCCVCVQVLQAMPCLMAPDMQQQPPVFCLSDVQCKSGAHLNCIAYDSSSSSSSGTSSSQSTGSLYQVYEVCSADADTITTKATQVHSVSTAADVFSPVDFNCCVHLLINHTSCSSSSFIGGNTTESCMRTNTVVYMQLILTMCTTTHVNFAGFTWHKS